MGIIIFLNYIEVGFKKNRLAVLRKHFLIFFRADCKKRQLVELTAVADRKAVAAARQHALRLQQIVPQVD